MQADKVAKEKEMAQKMQQMELKAKRIQQERQEQSEIAAQQAAANTELRKQATQKKKDLFENLEAFNID